MFVSLVLYDLLISGFACNYKKGVGNTMVLSNIEDNDRLFESKDIVMDDDGSYVYVSVNKVESDNEDEWYIQLQVLILIQKGRKNKNRLWLRQKF